MPDAWGIEPGYWDLTGTWHDTPQATRRALLAAMGGLPDVDDPPPRGRPVWFVRHGDGPPLQRPAELVLEDGSMLSARASLPPDLPLGYHELRPSDGGPASRLIVTPERCASAPDRAFGWTIQLYAARSRSSWGIGDLADLATVGRWAAGHGASVVAASPFHAPQPFDRQGPSPYFASSRRWRSPLLLRLEDVDGWDLNDVELAALADHGRSLLAARAIDHDRVWALKRKALERVWAHVGWGRADHDFVAWREAQGSELHHYAVFCALAEHYRTGWRAWPPEHRRPELPAVARFARAHADRVSFHAWVQWLLDGQLGAAARAGAGLVTDLAVGTDPDGADAWVWQDVLAPGVRVGAPPDDFNADGQDWGLPAFVPWRLRSVGYAPFASLLRAAFRHGAGLRIDHVMGLFRLFWIPEGATPAEGAYVRYPTTELLDIVALESARAGAFVVGEDLGTVEDGVRERLAERGVLSYRLVWFEAGPPETFPVDALAAVTTHDLPTVAGVWTGADDPDGRLRARLTTVAGVPDDAPVDVVTAAVHRRLAAAPSRLVAATLDDALGVVERPNVPGQPSHRPDGWGANWSLALPEPIDDLDAVPGVVAVRDALRTRTSGPKGRPSIASDPKFDQAD
ncbi:MAG: 4-alpha-glucanotransferase [Acidimicrobiales bacterium]